jgi:thiol-disulfide isomerase/thioredoxin
MIAGEFAMGSSLQRISAGDAAFQTSSAKATAVIFTSTTCPVSNDYNQRFVELYKDYADKGVQFVFVNSNVNESPDAMAQHAQANGFGFKVHKDTGNVLADQLNAQYTPEVFIFDQKGTLAYHGRIDDSRELQAVKSRDTRTTLDALLAGSAVPRAETKAFGCTIKRVKKTT